MQNERGISLIALIITIIVIIILATIVIGGISDGSTIVGVGTGEDTSVPVPTDVLYNLLEEFLAR